AFCYCGVAEFGAVLATCRDWKANVDFEAAWAAVYEHTQWADPGDVGGESLQSLIRRPFGEDAVGWRVDVLVADQQHRSGRVIAYDSALDAYLIRYSHAGRGSGEDSEEIWEAERMRWSVAMARNPSLAGRSRFHFTCPPEESWASRESRGSASIPRSLLSDDAPSPQHPSRRKMARMCLWGSWRAELKHNVERVPSRLVQRLDDHSDEVLFVAFSPCGTRLASCSRDCSTIVWGLCGGSGGEPPQFRREATLRHETSAIRAAWWPAATGGAEPAAGALSRQPSTVLLVTTEGASDGHAVQESTIEVWEVPPEGAPPKGAEDGSARCIFRKENQPYDIYAAIVEWPPRPLLQPGQEPRLCFLGGRGISFLGWPSGRFAQWLDVWPGPLGPGGEGCAEPGAPPLARLQVQCGVNYLHEVEAGPEAHGATLLALSGSHQRGNLCDELVRLDLSQARQAPPRGGELPAASADAPLEVPREVRACPERTLLSLKWSRSGDHVLLNTRPFVVGPGGRGGDGDARAAAEPRGLQRPPPDLSTSVELLVLDSVTLECVATFSGHFAFTTKESPFKIFLDDWWDLEFLASGDL
ncbi:unnamed protein product, partial [Prorocentrum cordatum]